MDPSSPTLETITVEEEEDGWDTEGFVIPSLGIEEIHQDITSTPELQPSKPSLKDKTEKIYLGPHGAPPSKQEPKPSSRKQQFKHKLKEADRKAAGTGRENKIDSLRELVGSKSKLNGNSGKASSRDWLDPHCDESQFEKRRPK
ncbi:hypothetical protein Droror1_Dr00014689 [Drosera rotundifolia]